MFWKGGIESKGGDCQVAWEVVCADKDEGGLGVRDLRTQNTSLLLKLIHKVVSRADSPWVNWIHCQYAPFSTGFKTSPSYTASWNTIARFFPMYQAITSVDVGDGTSTFFWHDDWTTMGPLYQAFPAIYSHCTDHTLKVSCFPCRGVELAAPSAAVVCCPR
ncbi:hypothetical protein PR202_gb02549 [Eleusine coracana subsp. coracana]|uniref:Reverse transcriptase zinc-binding domain-containing protein n=1 Tax=Eleusine coracana subsp. coracana TaxID=191504 RepID=A0AAV5DZN7_ELECO|nr:hypothetical protein PR202_gb02549 [Eleusine coracana subsp. coracana]